MNVTKRLFGYALNAFTLLELMVVVIIVGIVAGFSIPNYQKAIRKAHERDMAAQLTSIYAANLLYRSYNGGYWIATDAAVAAINTALSLNIIANDGTVYDYDSVTGGTFIATADWDAYTIKVTQVSIGTTNPCCDTDNCLSLSNCP